MRERILIFFTRKAVENTKQKGAERGKPRRPKLKEHEGVP
jgi:hypothetical protein